ncbi:hypothetical protein [Haloarcula litorea]|uniref:hypothetical protein n=1 Tax=Haloarcula litorea TaxID=3032579 RepID=UPI0023E87CF1|nr:hypothetical protein [Halomicroarcula sp. GDY20]
MRFKVAPPPRSPAFLADVQAAVPLLPDAEADCCRAIVAATDLSDRETARQYLLFARALGLVAESERGYHRTQADPDRATLADAYRERVFGVPELLAALEDGPLTAAEVFDAVRDAVPNWERERSPDWEREWRDRVEHLLGWAEAFGLIERRDGAYRRV